MAKITPIWQGPFIFKALSFRARPWLGGPRPGTRGTRLGQSAGVDREMEVSATVSAD